MTTDTPNTIESALASLRKPLADQAESDTVRATMPSTPSFAEPISYTKMAAENPANPKSRAYRGPLYSD